MRYDINQDKYEKESYAPFPKELNGTFVLYDSCGTSCITQENYFLCGGSSYGDGTELGTNFFGYNFDEQKWINLQSKSSVQFGLFPQIVPDNTAKTLHVIGGTDNDSHYEYNINTKTLQLRHKFDRNIFAAAVISDEINDRLILLGGKYATKETRDEPGKLSKAILVGNKNDESQWIWSVFDEFEMKETMCCYNVGYVWLPLLQTMILFGTDPVMVFIYWILKEMS